MHEARVAPERVKERRHLGAVEQVRAAPFNDGSLLDRIERQARPDLPQLHRLGTDGQPGGLRAVDDLDPHLEHVDRRDEDGRGQHRRELDHRQLRRRGRTGTHMRKHDDVDEALENRHAEGLDRHLGDDARRLVRREELLDPRGEWQDREQSKRFGEHKAI